MPWPPDQALISRAQQGSAEAFEALVIECQDRVYRFLMVNCQHAEDAEDALQETLMSAYRYLHSYNSRWQFSTWLFNIALRALAKRRRNQSTALPEQDHKPVTGPLAQCIKDHSRLNLWQLAQQHLAHNQFTALWLYYAEDMDIREIGKAMQKSSAWVKVTLFRARQKLQKLLKEQDEYFLDLISGEQQ